MALGSGLASQIGFGVESTPGTAATADLFLPFESETVNWSKTVLQGQGLRAGAQYDLASQRRISTVGAAGDVTVDYRYNKMGRLWKHALGSALTTPVVVTGSAYKQVHVPGGLLGLSLTYQKGIPQTDGTVKPFTFRGGKITGWEFAVSTGALPTFKPTFDFWDVSTATALAAASYARANNVFSWQDATLKIGGTASTTAGITTVTGGAALTTLANGFTLTGANPLKVDRQGLGNAGVKREQIENGFRSLTGSLAGEFTSESELWDIAHSDTTTALQFTMTSPGFITGSTPWLLDIILPSVKFDTTDLSVGGPDVVAYSPSFTVQDDDSGTNPPIQVTVQSTDTTI